MNRLSIPFAVLFTASIAQAGDAPVSATPPAWAGKMSDSTQNAAAFNDPAISQQWINAMMNLVALQNYLLLTDPSVGMNWMGAGMDPRFATPLISQGINPNAYLGMNLGMMQTPLSPQMPNPGLYGNWVVVPMLPVVMNAMMAPMNPGMYSNMMGVGMNSGIYGGWGQMLNMPAAMPGAIPLDPALLMKLMQMMPAPVAAQPAK